MTGGSRTFSMLLNSQQKAEGVWGKKGVLGKMLQLFYPAIIPTLYSRINPP